MLFRKIRNQWRKFISFLKFDFNSLKTYQEIQKQNYSRVENDIKQVETELKRINTNIVTLDNNLTCLYRSYSDLFNPELIGLLMTLPTDKVNVLICGYYGAPNLGDELMLQTLLKMIDRHKVHVTVMLTDYQCFDESRYGNVSIIHYLKTKNDYSILATRYDAVIFGGGAVLDEYRYSDYQPYSQELGQILLGLGKAFIAHEKKVIGIGLSTNTELKNTDFVKDLSILVNNSRFFSLRDQFSLETLRRCGIDVQRISIIKDIVWANDDILAAKQQTTDSIKKIGVIWAHFEEPVQYFINMLIELDNLISEPYLIKMIPFFTGCYSDLSFYRDVLSLCPDNLKNKISVLMHSGKLRNLLKSSMNRIVSLICAIMGHCWRESWMFRVLLFGMMSILTI